MAPISGSYSKLLVQILALETGVTGLFETRQPEEVCPRTCKLPALCKPCVSADHANLQGHARLAPSLRRSHSAGNIFVLATSLCWQIQRSGIISVPATSLWGRVCAAMMGALGLAIGASCQNMQPDKLHKGAKKRASSR